MLERTNNKKIDSIEENYCFGEACLIFNYNDTKRSVAFASKKDLTSTANFIVVPLPPHNTKILPSCSIKSFHLFGFLLVFDNCRVNGFL